jgi:hypothetical protein
MWLPGQPYVATFDPVRIIKTGVMKQPAFIIVIVLCVLLGTSFTVIYSNNDIPEKKTMYCCSKKGDKKQDKQAAVPVPYFPVINVF